MKLYITDLFGSKAEVESEVLPRVGDHVDMFYQPSPVVKEVHLWPKTRKAGYEGTPMEQFTALIIVG